MKKRDMANVTLFVTSAGGDVRCVSPEGEVKWAVGLAPGSHYAEQYRQYMEDGDVLEFTETISVMKKGKGRIKAQKFGELGFETGANPDYRPSAADAERRRMEQLLKQVTTANNSLEKRMKTFERLTAEQQAAAAAQAEAEAVVEEPETETPAEEPAAQ